VPDRGTLRFEQDVGLSTAAAVQRADRLDAPIEFDERVGVAR